MTENRAHRWLTWLSSAGASRITARPWGPEAVAAAEDWCRRAVSAEHAQERLERDVQAVRALADAIEGERSECGEWWVARDMGLARPERAHYPDEGWSFCDGCSAAQSATREAHDIAARIRAALRRG